jgi:iron(III) transport system permease protein
MAGLTSNRMEDGATLAVGRWIVLAWASYLVLPWYWLEAKHGFDVFGNARPALLAVVDGTWWLAPIAFALILATLGWRTTARERSANRLIAAGAGGLIFTMLQGFAVGLRGWNWVWLATLTGSDGPNQIGMGFGAALLLLSFLVILSYGLAGRGWCNGDAFIVSSIATVVALVGLFVFLPVTKILSAAFVANFLAQITDRSIWGSDCLYGPLRCGVAWNTVFLGVLVGIGSTMLGLAFALIAARTNFRAKRLFALLSILPIITPPFVIGLALILIFGRNGVVSAVLESWFDIPRSRWIYGLSGILIAQLLAFAPIAYLVLRGVVQGISPALEEASQTLRASRWTTFRTITWPLMRPGLANAFLLGFIESLADFGNPLVLGGNYDVLSTKIFFAVVGAAVDESRAAVLSIVLLFWTLLAFWLQRAWVGTTSYTTVAGKGDTGLPTPLPKRVAFVCYALAIPWSVFTVAIYALILIGGFVRSLGRDNTLTLEYLLTGFAIETRDGSWFFTGSAWNSLFATFEVAALAAPFTAAIGLMIAYLLSRQQFAGKRSFEFGTLLSFAIPGTVIGVSYILAFNVPPFELTGTGLILIICFVFRNMPVGIRSGIATLSQIDKSLDEASLTLGARSFTTIRRVIVPLLRPAIMAALVYSFVRAMTAVSAVIFLVSAKYNLATTYIVGRVEAGEFGLAIVYSSVLIVVMLVTIIAFQLAIGERRLGRRTTEHQADPTESVPAGAIA